MNIHKSLTLERVLEAVKNTMFGTNNTGFCIACGNEQEGCEPDMRKGECENCGAFEVYGAEELCATMI